MQHPPYHPNEQRDEPLDCASCKRKTLQPHACGASEPADVGIADCRGERKITQHPYLARLSKDQKDSRLPFENSTFYAWHHRKKHPEIFIKIGRSLFIDLRELDELIEKSRVKQNRSGA
jgi:hypothetical protein